MHMKLSGIMSVNFYGTDQPLIKFSTFVESISVFQCYTRYWFSVVFRHSCRFTASSGVKFFCFITLSTSLSHFISGLPLLLLPSGDQVIIRLGHVILLNTCPYHFNMLFSIVSKTVLHFYTLI